MGLQTVVKPFRIFLIEKNVWSLMPVVGIFTIAFCLMYFWENLEPIYIFIMFLVMELCMLSLSITCFTKDHESNGSNSKRSRKLDVLINMIRGSSLGGIYAKRMDNEIV